MWYIILYILFFVAQLLYGSWHILGPMTPRHIMTLIMFCVCIRQRAFIRDKYMTHYNIFVILFLLLGIGGGYVNQTLTKLIAYFFVSIVAYYSTLVFVYKYKGTYYLVLTLLVLGVLNSVVTIGNMFMMSWATRITDFLHLSNSAELLEYVDERINTETMDGFAVPGIISDVGNGYFMAYMSILALYSKDKRLHIYHLPLYLLFVVTLFFIQERTALVAGVVLSMYALFRLLTMQNLKISGHKRLMLIAIVIGGLIYLVPITYDYMTNGSSRYAIDGFDYAEGRTRLNDKSIEFLSSNPWGGFFDFFKQYHVYPHNLFFNALIYGGIIGGLSIFSLLWKQAIFMFSTITKKIDENDYDFFIFSLMFIAYNLCSLTHNQSVVTGDPTFWVLWALCVTIHKNTKKTKVSI